MSETEDISCGGLRFRSATRGKSAPQFVAFNRHEMGQILKVYGRKVVEGEWRDYAIDLLEDRAVFSIYRRASEFPVCRVEKVPALARRQGLFRVVAASGAILRRGHDLGQVLKVIDRPKLTLVRG